MHLDPEITNALERFLADHDPIYPSHRFWMRIAHNAIGQTQEKDAEITALREQLENMMKECDWARTKFEVLKTQNSRGQA